LVVVPNTPPLFLETVEPPSELELPTLPFPIAGLNTFNKNKGLWRSKSIRKADEKDVIGWAVEDTLTGQRWEFCKDMSWETFRETVGLEEGLWMWYEVTGANGETVVSAEDEFDTMQKLAISSWAGSKEYTHIQLGDPKDFQEESGSQRESESQGDLESSDMTL
jgi:hypothetical protein